LEATPQCKIAEKLYFYTFNYHAQYCVYEALVVPKTM